MTATLEELRAIAAEVGELRPDWTHGAVLNVLYEVREGRRVEEILQAATRAANDPTSRTPAAIGFPVHWQPKRAGTPGPFIANPLPECVHCGQPARRHVAGCYTPRCEEPGHLVQPPVTCPGCGRAWESIVFHHDREEARRRAVPPNAAFRAALAEVRARAPEHEDREPLAAGALLDRPARTPQPEPELVVPPW